MTTVTARIPLPPAPPESEPDVRRALEAVRAVAPLATARSADADRAGHLSPDVAEAMHERGLLRLLLPISEGGDGLDVAQLFRVIEASARADGAFGWCLCVANIGADMVLGGLGESPRRELLADPRLLLAAAVRPGAVTSTPVDGGRCFSGEIGFASGSAHASHFVAAALDEQPVGGIGSMVCGVVPRHEVRIRSTWNASGLRGTSSTHVAFDDVVVPERFVFRLSLADVQRDGLPLSSRLGAGLCAVALGIAVHAQDLFAGLAGNVGRFGSSSSLATLPDVQIAIARARALVDAGRAYVVTTMAEVGGRPFGSVTEDDLARLRLSYVTATQNAIAATDLVWEAAGASALFEEVGLERCWRDVHAAGQHAMVSTRHLTRLGQISLGLPAGPAPI